MPLDAIPSADEYYGAVHTYLDVCVKTKKETEELLAKGWRVALPTLFPQVFNGNFSDEQARYWDLFWDVTFRLRRKEKVPKKLLKRLLIWGRGLGKSTTIEVSALMKGAILNGGYCLYICETQDQANEHISNIRDLIENADSRFAEYFPDMAAPKKKQNGGSQEKWTESLFICGNGWICRAKGLNSKLRGIRMGKQRPTDIKIDDIDGENDSITVSIKKLRLLTMSILPTQAKLCTVEFAQNLIADNSVMSQVYKKGAALAERVVFGVLKTFIKLDVESYVDEEGLHRYRILPTSIPAWSEVDIEVAQGFLDDSNYETFLAEYQNEFDHQKQGKVVYEWNEERHIITWSQFHQKFGSRYIPPSWKCAAGTDLGFSKESLSAWTFVATAAQNSAIPGARFVYRGLTYTGKGIDEQAISLWRHLLPNHSIGKRHFEAKTDFGAYPEMLRLLRLVPQQAVYLNDYEYNPIENRFTSKQLDEDNAYTKFAESQLESQIEYWLMSHEKSGEQKTLAQKYGLPVRKTKHFGNDDGVVEWNHLLRGDYTKPHPFKEDRLMTEDECVKEMMPFGSYKLGCPHHYYIVADDQLLKPKDDRGLKTHRENNAAWEYTPEELTKHGLTERKPMKYKSDTCDSERMIYAATWGATSTPLTTHEKAVKTIQVNHPGLTTEAIEQIEDVAVKQQRLMRRGQKIRQIEQKIERPAGGDDSYLEWLRMQGQL